jgi:hypothetical protein
MIIIYRDIQCRIDFTKKTICPEWIGEDNGSTTTLVFHKAISLASEVIDEFEGEL